MALSLGHVRKTFARTRVVIASFIVLVWPFIFCEIIYALSSEQIYALKDDQICLSVKAARVSTLGSNFTTKLEQAILNDPVKVQALFQALAIACRSDLIDLSPTLKYQRLKELLRIGREEYESKGAISNETLRSLEQEVGVTKDDVIDSRRKIIGWQLVIDKKVKDEMRIRTAASLASHGYLFIEAFHQLSRLTDFQLEQEILLDAIEKTVKAILDNSDENQDGRIGWGRVWFKGKDGLLLHTSVPAQNMYFGGYTYFPRADSSGRSTCERSLPLKEEAFDHAHNTLFLLEAFLVTRDGPLAKRILLTIGKSFYDTFDEGAAHKQLGAQGWYYWKSLGKQRQMNQEECEVGREIKNTNLRMGLALLAFGEILMHNRDELRKDPGFSFSPEKYLHRAMQVIGTNNYEIFENNNFGYQGSGSRDVELFQEPDKKLPVYDRTQMKVGLNNGEAIGDLKEVVIAGNKVLKKDPPASVTICGGSLSAPVGDRGVAGSCWNHLAFESEDYFRIARFTNAWSGNDTVKLQEYLDAITRNLVAARMLHDGRGSRYAHYFPHTAEKTVSNEVVNAAFYGFFCMAKNLSKQSAVAHLPIAHQWVLGSLAEICKTTPVETEETGVTWRRGYKFYELYLAADRFSVPSDDWLLANKN